MFDRLYKQIRHRLHIPPGLVVLLVVLVLLYDVGGAIAAVAEMAMAMLAAVVGGGDHDAVTSVLWRTLPLALAAAGVTFAACNGWLQLDSLHSYVWMALIVLAGAVVGNACYERCGAQAVALPADSKTPDGTPKSIGPPVDTRPLGLRLNATSHFAVVPAPPTAWQRLTAIDWLMKPDLSRQPQSVEPLRVMPKGRGIYGGVGSAINQLLGYLVAYEPRLFLASIVAGSFVGWRLQQRVAVAHVVMSGELMQLPDSETKTMAA